MTNMAINPLRRRMIEDMTVRNFGEKTQKDYIRHIRNFTAFVGRSPDAATAEDLRLYQLHLTDTGIRPPTINSAVSVRFFFSVTVDRPEVTKRVTPQARSNSVPINQTRPRSPPSGVAGAAHRASLVLIGAADRCARSQR
jgi:integrase/recombinase XerD